MKDKYLFKVQLRGGFSDRNGIKKENVEIQYNNLDERTRTAIINMIDEISTFVRRDFSSPEVNRFWMGFLSEVYCLEIDHMGYCDEMKVLDIIKCTIREDDYDSVLTILEYYVSQISKFLPVAETIFNSLFEREYVGYRFVDGVITPITDENERNEVESAVQNSHTAVKEHLSKALTFMSNRDNPDYENSIKESISAVEAMCCSLLGRGTTLGQALKELEKNGLTIHPCMKIAFEKLYGYTSDASGIRHAGDIGGASSTFEEARFMLVACSAFINYLTIVSSKYCKE